uniref:Uncharacterized protein n=1 Tax=Heterorhabditis bacteriophora TaxID=37862 RepID=A0A1I7XAD7_HETBA
MLGSRQEYSFEPSASPRRARQKIDFMTVDPAVIPGGSLKYKGLLKYSYVSVMNTFFYVAIDMNLIAMK